MNVTHERAKFHSRTQLSGANVEAYIRNLYTLSETCGFDNAKEENIRDQLVVGITDKAFSQKLQLKDDLSLVTAIEICRTSELIKFQMAAQQSTVDYVNKQPQR